MSTPYGRTPAPGPGSNWGQTDVQSPRMEPTDPKYKPASRLQSSYGSRGEAARAAVVLRWLASYLVVVGASLVAHACFSSTSASSAGAFLLCSSMFVAVVAALGCAFYAGDREEIVKQARHYIFGLISVPGAGLALFSAAMRGFSGSPGQFDSFTALLSSGLPIIYFVTVCLPPVVFLKFVAGLRTIHRSSLASEELMAVYTRQDGLIR